jgi:hypothetical protein
MPDTTACSIFSSQRHAVLAGELDRADLQDLGAQRGHLQHLLEGDGGQAPGFGHDTRVGGVDTVHVGVDQALVGLHRRRHRHRRGVRTATTQRGDVHVLIDTLEAGDHDHAASVQIRAHAGVVDALDARLGVGGVGADGHLPAGVADGVHAFRLQRERQQTDRDLLAGAGDHVEFAGDGRRLDSGGHFAGQAEQAVGFTAHGGGDDHHLVTGAGPLGHALGDVADALGRAHRRAAVLVNDQSHGVVARWRAGESKSSRF